MKITKKLLIAVSTFAVILGGVSLMKTPQFFQQAIAQIPTTENLRSVPPLEDLNKPQNYNDNPTPTLPANKGLPIDQFILREEVIKILPANASLISADLVPWSQHQKTTSPNAVFHDISPERMIWNVVATYPNNLETGGGIYANAKQTIAVDAETGRIISSVVAGKLIQSSLPPDPPGYTPDPNPRW